MSLLQALEAGLGLIGLIFVGMVAFDLFWNGSAFDRDAGIILALAAAAMGAAVLLWGQA